MEKPNRRDRPYLIELELIEHRLYNPAYGNDRVCECGHPYYRHFDPYEEWAAVGCKFCGCRDFVEIGSGDSGGLDARPDNENDL